MVESSDKMWSTGEGNGKPLQYSCLENPMNSMKRQKDRTLKEELPRSVGAQYANGDHSFIFEIASKYCISDSFVDYDGYSVSSKGFLPTVVDIMVIWIKFTHSSPF